MASPGLGVNGADNNILARPELSSAPSSDTSNAIVGSEQEEIEQNINTSNEDGFPAQEDDEEEVQEEDGEDITDTSEIDLATMVPTPPALAAASVAPWSEGQKFIRGKHIYGVRLELSKPLLKKGFKGIDACLVHVQTRPNARLELFSRRKGDCGSFVVDLLRESGQHSLLAAAAKSAYLGETRIHEIPGGAKEDDSSTLVVNPRDVQFDDDGVRIAHCAFCVADSVFNVLMVIHRDLALAPISGEGDSGIFLRVRWCDEYGKISSFDDIMKMTTQSSEFPFNLARCTNKRLPGIEDGNLEHKMEYLISLSKEQQTRMFLLQCVSNDDRSSGHYVGLVDGMIYDNCASTGGKFPARKYAEENLSGVRKAAEIILRPRSKKNNKKKKKHKHQKRVLTSTLEQDENGSVQQKKARFDL